MLTAPARFALGTALAGGLVLAAAVGMGALDEAGPAITPVRVDRTVTLAAATPPEEGRSIDGLATDAISGPVFEPPSVPRADLRPAPTPREAQPLLRIPPMMPAGATRSGWCDLDYDVGIDGRTRDVVVTECSDTLFADAAAESVRRWIYQPRIVDGRVVPRPGMSSRVAFRLHDAAGEVIPE